MLKVFKKNMREINKNYPTAKAKIKKKLSRKRKKNYLYFFALFYCF